LKLSLPYKTSLLHWNVTTSLVPELFTTTKHLSQFSFSMLTSEGRAFVFQGGLVSFCIIRIDINSHNWRWPEEIASDISQ
jgi:hypothetical protein